MRRLSLIIAASLISTAAIPEADPQSARAFITEQAGFFAPVATAQVASKRRHGVRGSYAPDPTIVALVDRAADQAGLDRAVVRYHVARESSFRPDARNPRSTAKGLLQVIRGSHEAIVGRRMSLEEHLRLMAQPEYAMRVGLAHMKACVALMPGASVKQVYACHYHGHGRFGGRIQMAAAYYRPDAGGWLARGSVAMPWSQQERG